MWMPASFMEKFHISRKKATVLEGTIAFVIGTFVCLGYNVLYFEMPLPGGSKGQILDVIRRNCGAKTIKGVKMRCRPGMGRCQGGFCGPRISEVFVQEYGYDVTD